MWTRKMVAGLGLVAVLAGACGDGEDRPGQVTSEGETGSVSGTGSGSGTHSGSVSGTGSGSVSGTGE